MESKKQIKKMESSGWTYYNPCIHIQMIDPTKPSGYTRLSYDLTNQTDESLAELRRWVEEVNLRFDPIKIVIKGDGYSMDVDNEEIRGEFTKSEE